MGTLYDTRIVTTNSLAVHKVPKGLSSFSASGRRAGSSWGTVGVPGSSWLQPGSAWIKHHTQELAPVRGASGQVAPAAFVTLHAGG